MHTQLVNPFLMMSPRGFQFVRKVTPAAPRKPRRFTSDADVAETLKFTAQLTAKIKQLEQEGAELERKRQKSQTNAGTHGFASKVRFAGGFNAFKLRAKAGSTR